MFSYEALFALKMIIVSAKTFVLSFKNKWAFPKPVMERTVYTFGESSCIYLYVLIYISCLNICIYVCLYI